MRILSQHKKRFMNWGNIFLGKAACGGMRSTKPACVGVRSRFVNPVRMGKLACGGMRSRAGVFLRGVKPARTAAFSLALSLILALSFALMPILMPASLGFMAYGDDTDSNNEVNPQQLPDSSFIYDTSIADLAGADAYFDGQTVQVVGEVIGDAINSTFDSKHKWITLEALDSKTTNAPSISVFMNSSDTERIDTFGAYGKTGTSLQVRGTFHLACEEHEGLTDLHAENVSVVKKGTTSASELNWQSFIPGTLCLLAGIILLVIFNHLRERQR